MIKNIVFDCSDTLLRFHASEDLAAELSNSERAERIHQAIFKSDAWKEYDLGFITEEELLKRTLPLLPKEDRPVAEGYMAHWTEHYTPMPGMEALVKTLKKKGYGLYVLSSYPDRFYELWERYSVFRCFDGVGVSFEAHGTKAKEGHLFDYLLEKYRLRAEECLMIDDSPVSIETARRKGWSGIHFRDAETLKQQLSTLEVL